MKDEDLNRIVEFDTDGYGTQRTHYYLYVNGKPRTYCGQDIKEGGWFIDNAEVDCTSCIAERVKKEHSDTDASPTDGDKCKFDMGERCCGAIQPFSKCATCRLLDYNKVYEDGSILLDYSHKKQIIELFDGMIIDIIKRLEYEAFNQLGINRIVDDYREQLKKYLKPNESGEEEKEAGKEINWEKAFYELVNRIKKSYELDIIDETATRRLLLFIKEPMQEVSKTNKKKGRKGAFDCKLYRVTCGNCDGRYNDICQRIQDDRPEREPGPSNKKDEVEYEPIPSYGTLMTKEEWIELVEAGGFIDYDGHGCLAYEDRMSKIEIQPSDYKNKSIIIEPHTHVIWFNK